MSCMLCAKTAVRLFNVHETYGIIKHTVRDDLEEILGNADWNLTPTDCVCNVCMNVLDNMAKLKRRLWGTVSSTSHDRKPIKLGKLWSIFGSVKVDELLEEDIHSSFSTVPTSVSFNRAPTPSSYNRAPTPISCNRAPTPTSCNRAPTPTSCNRVPTPTSCSRAPTPTACNRAPTPANLLVLNYAVPYRNKLESEIAERERQRSLSRSSSRLTTQSSEGIEVQNTMSRKRKKTRKKCYRWTRLKGRRSKSTHSATPSEYSTSSNTFRQTTKKLRHNYSPLSDCSYLSTYRTRVSPAKRKRVEYDEQGRLVTKLTRSVSRLQEKLEKTKFYCHEDDCILYFQHVEVLNYHRIKDHNLLALHYCDECQQTYTTAEHLRLHSEVHDTYPFHCIMCGFELANKRELQKHLDEHILYSVPCKYCDKSFLDKTLCNNHIKTAHRFKRKPKIIREELIIDRFDRSSESEKDCATSDYVEDLNRTDGECEREELDVTIENLIANDVDFVLMENEECSNSEENQPADQLLL